MKKINLFCVSGLTILFLSWSPPIQAEAPSAYGPESKRFGVGLHLGEPTGLTVKGFITRRWAADAIVSWSFVDEALTLIGDATYEFLDLPVKTTVVTVPFYAGVGGKVGISAGPNDRTVGGVRIPLGLAAQWTRYPVEAFLEIAPGLEVAPETEFNLIGGIGARFYF